MICRGLDSLEGLRSFETVTRRSGNPVSISARYEAIVAVNGEFEIKELRNDASQLKAGKTTDL